MLLRAQCTAARLVTMCDSLIIVAMGPVAHFVSAGRHTLCLLVELIYSVDVVWYTEFVWRPRTLCQKGRGDPLSRRYSQAKIKSGRGVAVDVFVNLVEYRFNRP